MPLSRKRLLFGVVSMFVVGLVNGMTDGGKTPRDALFESVLTLTAFTVGYRLGSGGSVPRTDPIEVDIEEDDDE